MHNYIPNCRVHFKSRKSIKRKKGICLYIYIYIYVDPCIEKLLEILLVGKLNVSGFFPCKKYGKKTLELSPFSIPPL